MRLSLAGRPLLSFGIKARDVREPFMDAPWELFVLLAVAELARGLRFRSVQDSCVFMWLLMILLSRLGRAFVQSEAPSVSTAPSLEAGERVPLERRWGSLPLGKAFFSCSSC